MVTEPLEAEEGHFLDLFMGVRKRGYLPVRTYQGLLGGFAEASGGLRGSQDPVRMIHNILL